MALLLIHSQAEPVLVLRREMETLHQAAASLCPPFQIGARGRGLVELRDPRGALPDITLRLQKERRLFSRTFALVVEAFAPSHGPEESVSANLERSGLRRRPGLRPSVRTPEAAEWTRRLEGSGLLEGVRTMTSVLALEARWGGHGGAARLRLVTLAGALIGTAPTTSIAVPLEAEDVDGLLRILRALRQAAGGEA